jgi:DMSO reductase family type II enzyme heme b subunit
MRSREAMLAFVALALLAARPGFEAGAPVLQAAACPGQLTDCSAPTAPAWEAAPAYAIPLRMTPPHKSSDELPEQSIDTIEVRALAAVDGLVIRLAWHDESVNLAPGQTGQIGSFPDSVAVQLPVVGEAEVLPALAMGSAERPVNIWHWSAGVDEAEESVAEGFGLLRALAEPTPVGASAQRSPAGWVVTLWRPYAAEPMRAFRGEAPESSKPVPRAPLAPGERVSCAFAVWNGQFRDRDGLKAVSIWYHLELPARLSSR